MPALLGTPFLGGEVHRLLLCLVCGPNLSLSFAVRVGIVWQDLDAQELKPQTIYAIEDAEELRLVYDLPREDRLPVRGLHPHAFEGDRVPFTELASGHYAIDGFCALLAHHASLLVGSSYTPIALSQKQGG